MAPSSKPVHREKKPRASRKVVEKGPEPEHVPEPEFNHVPVPEDTVPEPIPDKVREPIVLHEVLPVVEVKEEVIEDETPVELEEVAVEETQFALEAPALEESQSSSCPPLEESDDSDSPVSPCVSPKARRVKKEAAPKAAVNEAGDYLNPKTNRYVKQGTAAFKRLVREGVIVVAESI